MAILAAILSFELRQTIESSNRATDEGVSGAGNQKRAPQHSCATKTNTERNQCTQFIGTYDTTPPPKCYPETLETPRAHSPSRLSPRHRPLAHAEANPLLADAPQSREDRGNDELSRDPSASPDWFVRRWRLPLPPPAERRVFEMVSRWAKGRVSAMERGWR